MEREGKALKPTALGEVTTGLMEEQFPEIVDVDFTANMERQLDGVESGKADWVQTLDHFYDGFSKTLQKAEEATSGERIKVPEVESDVVCELCGRKMVIKSGRYGKFLACPGYPECKNTKRIVEETPVSAPNAAALLWLRNPRTTASFSAAPTIRTAISSPGTSRRRRNARTAERRCSRKKGRNAGLFLPDRGLRL